MTHRLLVQTGLLDGERAVLPPAAMHHLKVVRPRQGEFMELFDGAGSSRLYRVDLHSGPSPTLTAAGAILRHRPRRFRTTLFACVTKGSRWDWTIEKATELGVARIVPVISERCIVRIPKGERAAKRERWRRIAEDAARQSDAQWLPVVCEAMDFSDALALAKGCTCFAGALVDPPPEPLLAAVRRQRVDAPEEEDFGLFVGPEGDFTPEELEELLKFAVPTSFGDTILRAETAAIFGLSAIVAACQERMTAASRDAGTAER